MKTFIKLVSILLFFILPTDSFITGCSNRAPRDATILHATQAQTNKVVLVTIDGVRWQDVFNPSMREKLPTIYNRFIDGGIAIGHSSHALVGGPAHVSMPGYLEIIRGHSSLDCTNNYCPHNKEHTIFNQFRNSSAVVAGWETIAATFDNSIPIVNIGRRIRNNKWTQLHVPNTDKKHDYFGMPDYRFDEDTFNAAIALLKEQQPDLLWISLGDTDEWAHRGNYEMYMAALAKADTFIQHLMSMTSVETTYIVCPDHGRSADFNNHGWEPESARVWILMTGRLVPAAGFVRYDRNVYLSDIVPTIMNVARGTLSNKSLLNYLR